MNGSSLAILAAVLSMAILVDSCALNPLLLSSLTGAAAGGCGCPSALPMAPPLASSITISPCLGLLSKIKAKLCCKMCGGLGGGLGLGGGCNLMNSPLLMQKLQLASLSGLL